MSLNLEEINLRAKQNHKTLICEVEKKGNIRNFKIICDFCNNIIMSNANSFDRCEKCYSKLLVNSRNTFKEEFIEKSKIVHNNKYNYDLVEYINSKNKVKIFCNDCNNIFFQTPSQHIKGSGCLNCYHNKLRHSKETFIEKSKNMHEDRYNYDLVEYFQSNIKVKILCNSCNNIFEQRPNDHLKGYGCKICGYDSLKLTKQKFINKSKSIHGNKFNYDEVEYTNNVTKVIIKCNFCCNVFKQRPSCHLSGKGCPICAINLKKTTLEDFISKCYQIHGNRYNYDSVVYNGSRHKIEIWCLKCNHLFFQKASHHLSGKGCPRCKESKGEKRIAKYLSSIGLNFETQYTYNDLRNINHLRFDFFVTSLGFLIEFDGIGHYKAIFGFTLEEKKKNLEDCQLRDKIKNEWVKANNIALLRIPYWDFDRIEELIGEFIKRYM